MQRFKLIECLPTKKAVPRYERDRTVQKVMVDVYETGPDARAFSAALHKRWAENTAFSTSYVAAHMGLEPIEVHGLEIGKFMVEDWPAVHKFLRELPAPPKPVEDRSSMDPDALEEVMSKDVLDGAVVMGKSGPESFED